MENNGLIKKPALPTLKCEEMLYEAVTYIAVNSPTQAKILFEEFDRMLEIIERMPGIGTKYKNGMRKINLGKFRRYNIFYKENETDIEILGIWHTSRGTAFEDKSLNK
jgi:plasmid stabilization system protein ParE